MTLFGSGFHNFDARPDSARCIWGEANLPTLQRKSSVPSLLERGRAVCPSVEVSEDSPFFYASVKLALNGVEYGEPQFLRFYDQPSLFLEILPVTGGPVAGGTLITLGGYGFRNFDDDDTALGKARCGWGDGDTIVPVEIVTEYIVCATTPKARPGAQNLFVSLNGLDYVDTGKISLRSPSSNLVHPACNPVHPACNPVHPACNPAPPALALRTTGKTFLFYAFSVERVRRLLRGCNPTCLACNPTCPACVQGSM